jgi:hypothetical protein
VWALFAKAETNGDDRDAVAGFFELALEELGQTGSSVAGVDGGGPAATVEAA